MGAPSDCSLPACALALLAALTVAGGLAAAPLTAQVLAIQNARIYPVTAPEIPNGVLLVRNGKIAAVGADVRIPAGATVIDAAGRSVMPGMVESHSHMGLKQLWVPTTGSNNNELSRPINAEVWAFDGLSARDVAFALAIEAGVTTMNITTGSRSPNSGQAVVVKLRGGTAQEMFFAHGGMKFAMRATERRPNFPAALSEVPELLRAELRAAREYLGAWRRYAADGRRSDPPARDLKLEALAKLLTQEWVVGVHAHSEEEMRYAMELKQEFGLDLYIHHANATNVLAGELARAGIPVSYGPVLPFHGREDPELEGPVRLGRLGGTVAFHQDHPDGPQYYLRHSAALFVRKGMSESDALRALTLNGARLFRLEHRIGSLEPGKDADFVILTGPPLEWESLVERVFVEGREVYDRATGRNVFRTGGAR